MGETNQTVENKVQDIYDRHKIYLDNMKEKSSQR